MLTLIDTDLDHTQSSRAAPGLTIADLVRDFARLPEAEQESVLNYLSRAQARARRRHIAPAEVRTHDALCFIEGRAAAGVSAEDIAADLEIEAAPVAALLAALRDVAQALAD